MMRGLLVDQKPPETPTGSIQHAGEIIKTAVQIRKEKHDAKVRNDQIEEQ